MRDPDVDPGFSWPLALLITGLCFIAFFYILGKLNENSPRIFLWIGVASLVIGFVSALGSLFANTRTSSRNEQID